jgi:hypothetical protein
MRRIDERRQHAAAVAGVAGSGRGREVEVNRTIRVIYDFMTITEVGRHLH